MIPLQKALSIHHQVFRMSFSGHAGNSLPDQSFGNKVFAQDVLAFLDEQGIHHIHVFGHSMGGYVGVYLAKKFPERIASVFTLGTKWDWTPEVAAREVNMLNPAKMEEKVPHFAQLLAQRHAPIDWKEIVRRTAEMMQGLGNGKALSEADFQSIQTRICVGIGELDNMVSREESQRVADWLPNGSLLDFAGFKHPIEKVNPETLAASISSWIR